MPRSEGNRVRRQDYGDITLCWKKNSHVRVFIRLRKIKPERFAQKKSGTEIYCIPWVRKWSRNFL